MLSLEAASRLFDWSSIALAIGACIVFVATAAIVWLGIVKEHHWDVLREQANEKIAAVGLDAAKSNAEAAKAHERIAELSAQAEELRKSTAEANARAEEARLALEKFKAPRTLDSNLGTPIVEGLKEFAGTRVDVIVNLVDSDAHFFGNRVYNALANAGWKAKTWNAVGSFPVAGVAVSVTMWDGDFDKIKPLEKMREAGDRLVALLKEAGVEATSGMPFSIGHSPGMDLLGQLISGPVWDPNDIAPIRIIIGPKPQ